MIDLTLGDQVRIDGKEFVLMSLNIVMDHTGMSVTLFGRNLLLAEHFRMEEEKRRQLFEDQQRVMRQHLDHGGDPS